MSKERVNSPTVTSLTQETITYYLKNPSAIFHDIRTFFIQKEKDSVDPQIEQELSRVQSLIDQDPRMSEIQDILDDPQVKAVLQEIILRITQLGPSVSKLFFSVRKESRPLAAHDLLDQDGEPLTDQQIVKSYFVKSQACLYIYDKGDPYKEVVSIDLHCVGQDLVICLSIGGIGGKHYETYSKESLIALLKHYRSRLERREKGRK